MTLQVDMTKVEAAALDLLTALMTLEAVIESDTLTDDEVEQQLPAALKQARAAIARATGDDA